MLSSLKIALKRTSVRNIVIFSLLFFVISNLVGAFILLHFPNSGDEYAYYFQAQIFAAGKLFAPAPPSDKLITDKMILYDGKWFVQYPPGWPAFLSIGMLIGMPWIINPIFSTITLLVLYFISKELYDDNVALKSIFLLIISPFFILTSASYFSHPTALFFSSLFLYFFFQARKTNNTGYYHILGMISLAILAYIRTYTAFLFVIPYFGYLITRREIKNLVIVLIVGSAALIPLFLYNSILTGDPISLGYQLYSPSDRPGFGVGGYTPSMIPGKALNMLFEFCIFFPAIILIPLYLFRSDFYEKKENIFLLCIFLSVFIGFLLYKGTGGDRFGPRYLYETLSCITPLCTGGLSSLPKLRNPMKGLKITLPVVFLISLIVFSIGSFIDRSVYYFNYINDRKQIFDIIEHETPVNSIIFIAEDNLPAPFYSEFFCRNDPFLKERIYAPHTTIEDDLRIANMFPERTPFIYNHTNKEVIPLFTYLQVTTQESPRA
jgi:hypothetical protein